VLCLLTPACAVVNDPIVVERSTTQVVPVEGEAQPSPSSTPSEPAEAGTDQQEPAAPVVSPSRSVSAGDPRFPELGSADIDVDHYVVTLTYDYPTRIMVGTMSATGTIVNPTDQIALDTDGPDVSGVRSNAAVVNFSQRDQELIIELGEVSAAGSTFSVDVDFSVTVGEKNFYQGGVGLFPTAGGLWSVNEPDGASTWLPVNDHPTDKATWTFEVTVPDGVTAVANGELSAVTEMSDATTWSWQQTEPMAPYLITLLIGDYELVDDGTSASGVELQHVVLRARRGSLDAYLTVTRQQLTFFESLFGPYPFDRYGVAIADSEPGLAMETQGLSLFSTNELDGTLGPTQQAFLSHELAHQWFGDAVSPATWNDIWLNEGFATYAEWLWMEEAGLATTDQAAERFMIAAPQLGWPLSAPAEMFGTISYLGGATVLHALRLTIGDAAFFAGLRNWVVTYLDDSATTVDFQAVMEQSAGTDLDDFFDDWVYAESIPSRLPS